MQPSQKNLRFAKYEGTPLPINLGTRSGTGRWAVVMDSELHNADRLFESAWKLYPPAARAFSGWFGDAYRDFDGPYQNELQAWGKALGREFGEVAMVNCAYELEQLWEAHTFLDISETLLQKLFACTAGIVCLESNELAHVRTLDWSIPGMAAATRIFQFNGGKHTFITIGFPGFVGALSGMVPGQYSATINWAPPQQAPSFDHAPAFLLRESLERCGTYSEAKAHLSTVKLATSVFFTLCGLNEGCVIERTPDQSRVRDLEGGLVAQSNHHVAPDFEPYNVKLQELKKDDFLVRNTRDRRISLEDALKALVGTKYDEKGLFAALDAGEVTNCETSQRMIFRPKSGEIILETAV
jgi:hypothetical protein